jgi:hypothetical protein
MMAASAQAAAPRIVTPPPSDGPVLAEHCSIKNVQPTDLTQLYDCTDPFTSGCISELDMLHARLNHAVMVYNKVGARTGRLYAVYSLHCHTITVAVISPTIGMPFMLRVVRRNRDGSLDVSSARVICAMNGFSCWVAFGNQLVATRDHGPVKVTAQVPGGPQATTSFYFPPWLPPNYGPLPGVAPPV